MFPGDVVVGDKDGVMVIPAHLAAEIADECAQMEVYETFVMQQVRQGEPITGLYPLTGAKQKEAYANWLKKNKG